MEEVVKRALSLVINKGIKQRCIYKAITKAVINASKGFPEVRVMYNANYRSEFQEYKKSFTQQYNESQFIRKKDRVKDVPIVMAYGRQVIAKYPFVGSVVEAYYCLKLEEASRVANQLTQISNKLEWIDKNKSENCEMLLEMQQEICKNEQILKDLLGPASQTFQDEAHIPFKEEISFNKAHMWGELDFAEAVEKYGERHIGPWIIQQSHSLPAIRYLFRHPELLSDVSELLSDSSIEKYEDVHFEVGAMFAAEGSSSFMVEKVPKFAGWKIHVYDGVESVKLI